MKKVFYNVITVFLFLLLFEIVSFCILKFKYTSVYERYSSTFLFKTQSDWTKYDKNRANYFLMHPLYGVKFKPNSTFYGLSPDSKGFPVYEKVFGLDTDQFGYVKTIPRIKNADKAFRIITSGGSTTAGWGASSNSKTWPSVLQSKIQNYFDKNSVSRSVEVINTGVLGYAISQEVQQYLSETQFLKPDLVISFSGINERWSYDGNPVDYSLSGHQSRIISLINGKKGLKVAGLFPNIKLLIKYKTQRRVKYKYGYKNSEFLKMKTEEIYLQKVGNFKNLVTGNKSKFLYILQPLMGVCPEELKIVEKPFKNFFDSQFYKKSWKGYIGKARNFYSNVRGNLKEPWQLDLTCFFEDIENSAYFDPRHYNDFGQEALAERIFKELIKRELI